MSSIVSEGLLWIAEAEIDGRPVRMTEANNDEGGSFMVAGV